MAQDPERWKLRQKSLYGLLTWAFATVTVLAWMATSWLMTPAPLSTAAGTGGTGGTSGAVVSLAFVNSSGDPLPELILSNAGVPSKIFVSASGMTVGVHDTVQLLLRHDPALTEVITIGCSGVFGGGHSPPGLVAIAAGEVAFECGLEERVGVADGIVAELALRRVSAGVDALELVPDGPFGVRLFSSGVPSQAQPGLALSIVDPPPSATTTPASTATAAATASPTPATGGGAPSGGGGGFFAPQPSPTAAFFPPGLPRELDVTVGNGWADLTWLPPTSDGGAGITQYVVWSADGTVNRQVAGDAFSTRATGLENGREYSFRVRAINGIGAGQLTEPSAPVIPAGPPSAPVGLIGVSVPSEAGVRLSWSPPELLNGAEIESYTITEETGLTNQLTVEANALSHLFQQLGPGNYLFSVFATNRGGSGPAASAAAVVAEPPEQSGLNAVAQLPLHVDGRPLHVDEQLLVDKELGAALGAEVKITSEPLTLTAEQGRLRVVLPAASTSVPAGPGEFTGFQAGRLSLVSKDGLPDTAELNLGDGLTISGKVTIASNGEEIVMDLSSMVLLFTPGSSTQGGEGSPVAIDPQFTASILELSEVPSLSTTLLEGVGAPHLPSMASLTRILAADKWPIFTETPVALMVVKIEHPTGRSMTLGDTTLAFELSTSLQPGSVLIAVKQSDTGDVHTRPVSCQHNSVGNNICIAVFDGPAAGFSTFAILQAIPISEAEPDTDVDSDTDDGSDTGPLGPVSTPVPTATPFTVATATSEPAPESMVDTPPLIGLPAQTVTRPVTPTALPFVEPPVSVRNTEQSLPVVIGVIAVFAIAGLGVAGYFVNRRRDIPITIILTPLAATAALTMIASSSYGHISQRASAAGPTGGEGDVAQRSNEVRDVFGVDGTGVTVGIISDSYGCDEDALAADIASGELPSDVAIIQDVPGIFCPFTSDRGRAIAQLVHDVAPGAELMFQTAVFGKAAMAASIFGLAAAGADIILDDIQFANELQFQDDLVAQAVDQVVAAGTFYFAAAGDTGESTYDSEFITSGTLGAECSSSAPVICTLAGTRHDFDSGPGVDRFLDVSLPEGKATFMLQWEQPGASAGGIGNSTVADLFVYDSAGVPVGVSGEDNAQSGEPVEVVEVNGLTSVKVSVSYRSGPLPGRIRLVATDGAVITEHQTESGSITGHSNAAGAITVGSVHYTDTAAFGGTPVVQQQSSRGGVEILFGQDGIRLNPPVLRQKPDLVAPSGADTALGAINSTSAAVAHAAGATALLFELRSDLRATGALGPEVVRWLLTQIALDIPPAGPDLEAGYGLLDAWEAAVALNLETPEAAEDAFSVNMNSVLTVPAPGILVNDVDLNGHVLTPVLASGPEHGDLVLNGDGSFTFTPDSGFLGIDSFSYMATDGAFMSEPSTVTITVIGIESVRTEAGLQGVGRGAGFGADDPLIVLTGGGTVESVNFAPWGSGTVLFTGLDPGTYALTASAPGFLTAVRSGLTLGAVPGFEAVVPSIELLAGDATDDGVIDAADAAVMTSSFGSVFAAGNRRNGEGDIADMNGDGVSNGADLSLTLSNLGRTAPVAW